MQPVTIYAKYSNGTYQSDKPVFCTTEGALISAVGGLNGNTGAFSPIIMSPALDSFDNTKYGNIVKGMTFGQLNTTGILTANPIAVTTDSAGVDHAAITAIAGVSPFSTTFAHVSVSHPYNVPDSGTLPNVLWAAAIQYKYSNKNLITAEVNADSDTFNEFNLSIGSASTQILAAPGANLRRTGLIISNSGGGIVHVMLNGGVAGAAAGLHLPVGGFIQLDEKQCPQGIINAYSAAAGTAVYVYETLVTEA